MALSSLPPPSVTYQCTPLIDWIWYDAPMGTRFCSRTQNESRVAGWATTLSACSCSSRALTIGVPSSWLNITTSSLMALYSWTAVGASYAESRMTSSTGYCPATPPSSSLTYSQYARLPLVSGSPMTATIPLVGVTTPRRIVSPSKPGTGSGAAASSVPSPSSAAPSSSSPDSPPHAAATSAKATKAISHRRHRFGFTMVPPIAVVGQG